MRLVNAAPHPRVGLAAALSGALVACGGSAAQRGICRLRATTTSASAAAANTGVSNGQTYPSPDRPQATHHPDRTGRWTLTVDTISRGRCGGRAFNRAVRASAQGPARSVKRDAGSSGTWSFDTDQRDFFRQRHGVGTDQRPARPRAVSASHEPGHRFDRDAEP